MVIAGVVSLIAVAVTVASLAWLHVQRTGLSWLQNPVSEYGITPFRSGYRVATIAFGVAGLALAIGVDRAIAGHGTVRVVALLVVFAAARGAISWFPMDAPDAPRTSTGGIHVLLASGAFLTKYRRSSYLAWGYLAQRDAMALSPPGVDSARVCNDTLPGHVRLVARNSGPPGAVRRDRAWLLRVRHRLDRAVRVHLCGKHPLKARARSGPALAARGNQRSIRGRRATFGRPRRLLTAADLISRLLARQAVT